MVKRHYHKYYQNCVVVVHLDHVKAKPNTKVNESMSRLLENAHFGCLDNKLSWFYISKAMVTNQV